MVNRLYAAWNGLVRTGFRLLYHEMSWTYDAVSHVVSQGQWGEWRRTCLPFVIGPRVLELGYGPGHLQVELAERGFATTGLDASAHMARTASRRLLAANRPSAVVVGSAQQLPYPGGHFNTVVATFPTPYIAEIATLAEVRRVLAPDGRLVIVPEAQLSGGGPFRRLIDVAYRITGQRHAATTDVPWRWADALSERLSSFGLQSEIHDVALEGSQVTVVVGRRLTG